MRRGALAVDALSPFDAPQCYIGPTEKGELHGDYWDCLLWRRTCVRRVRGVSREDLSSAAAAAAAAALLLVAANVVPLPLPPLAPLLLPFDDGYTNGVRARIMAVCGATAYLWGSSECSSSRVVV